MNLSHYLKKSFLGLFRSIFEPLLGLLIPKQLEESGI